jgi:hypothetical protein
MYLRRDRLGQHFQFLRQIQGLQYIEASGMFSTWSYIYWNSQSGRSAMLSDFIARWIVSGILTVTRQMRLDDVKKKQYLQST